MLAAALAFFLAEAVGLLDDEDLLDEDLLDGRLALVGRGRCFDADAAAFLAASLCGVFLRLGIC